MAAGGFEHDATEAIIEKGNADLVAFGRHFLANPDFTQANNVGNSDDRARMVPDFLTRMDLGEMLGKVIRSALLVSNPDRANRIGERK